MSTSFGCPDDTQAGAWLAVRSLKGKQLRAVTAAICFILLSQKGFLVAGLSDGDVRLSAGKTFLEGRVQIYHNYNIGYLCGDNFDSNVAEVVCRQLGLTGGVASCCDYGGVSYGWVPSDNNFWGATFTCQGTESKLTDCNWVSWGLGTCTSVNPGVTCTLPSTPPSFEWTGSSATQLPSTCGKVLGWGNSKYIPPLLTNGVATVASGEYHSLALLTNGQVISWNDAGLMPVPDDVASGVVDIKAGVNYSLALTSSGNAVAWGSVNNAFGILDVPAPVRFGNVMRAISAGSQTAYALYNTGQVTAWGAASLDVPAFAQDSVISIAAGAYHTVALKSNGKVVAWGDQDLGKTNVPAEAASSIKAIAAGYSHSMALTTTGKVLSWGIIDSVPLEATSNVIAIAAGYESAMALTSTGQVIAWGINGVMIDVSPVTGWPLAIAAGKNQFLALAEATGDCVIALPPSPPSPPPSPPEMLTWGMSVMSHDPMLYVSMVRGGNYHAIALHLNGSVTCWGTNDKGQCNIPGQVVNSQALLVAAGGDVSMALLRPAARRQLLDNTTNLQGLYSGDLYVWGKDLFGIISQAPKRLDNVVALEMGATHALVLYGDGTVSAWGDNVSGQTNIPEKIQALGATAIAAGHAHSLALVQGRVIAWGRNSEQQTNVPISAQSNVVAIAAGMVNSLALKTDGSVIEFGISGVPSTVQSAVSIAAGNGFSIALLQSGDVIVWGPASWIASSVPTRITKTDTSLYASSSAIFAITGYTQPVFQIMPRLSSSPPSGPRFGLPTNLYAATAVSVIVGPLVMAIMVFVSLYMKRHTFLVSLADVLHSS